MPAKQVKQRRRAGLNRAAKRVIYATDAMLVKLGKAAAKRLRTRKARSALKRAGKVALVIGAGAATAYAGRKALTRAKGRGKKRKRG